MYIFAIITSILAGILQIGGYYLYVKKVFSGHIIPNAASWLIWTMGGVLVTTSYILVSGDLVKNLLPIVCASSSVAIFIICLKRGRFSKINKYEWLIIMADIIITIYWFLSQETFISNILYLFGEILAFIPLVLYVWKNPLSESAAPWVCWSVAYLLMGITVILRYEKWQDLAYPIILLILSGVVSILSSDYIIKRRISLIDKKETAIDNI